MNLKTYSGHAATPGLTRPTYFAGSPQLRLKCLSTMVVLLGVFAGLLEDLLRIVEQATDCQPLVRIRGVIHNDFEVAFGNPQCFFAVIVS